MVLTEPYYNYIRWIRPVLPFYPIKRWKVWID